MGRITPDMKVARLVERHPETVDVFLAYGCPDMRRGFFGVMARLMSVRSAARMHRIPLNELMTDLGSAVEGASGERSEEGVETVRGPPP